MEMLLNCFAIYQILICPMSLSKIDGMEKEFHNILRSVLLCNCFTCTMDLDIKKSKPDEPERGLHESSRAGIKKHIMSVVCETSDCWISAKCRVLVNRRKNISTWWTAQCGCQGRETFLDDQLTLKEEPFAQSFHQLKKSLYINQHKCWVVVYEVSVLVRECSTIYGWKRKGTLKSAQIYF